MFKILSGITTTKLEEEVSKYDVKLLGSLVTNNGHYYQSLEGELKKPKEEVLPLVTPVVSPVVSPSKPKKPKSKPKGKPKEKEKEKLM